MDKNVIYQVDTYWNSQLSALEQFKYNNMIHFGSYSIRKYAEKIKCDYEIIRPKPTEDIWTCAMLEKTNLFKRLLDSSYDNFCFFDLDVKASDDACNIFEISTEDYFIANVVGGTENADNWSKKQKKIISQITGIFVNKYISASCFSCGRSLAKIFQKYVEKFSSSDLRKSDERFLSYVVEVEKIPIINIENIHEKFPKNIDFIHYAGKTKEFMNFNLKEVSEDSIFKKIRFRKIF